ncbi:hypothetical protein CsatB_029245 [Cannabis sativa]
MSNVSIHIKSSTQSCKTVVTKPEGEKEIQVQILIMLCSRKESRARDVERKKSLYSVATNIFCGEILYINELACSFRCYKLKL